VAALMTREGADISMVYLPKERADAEDTKAIVEQEVAFCLLIPGDLGDQEFCRQAVETHAVK
jgi:hypothetical protein